jgi:hypothetical protein
MFHVETDRHPGRRIFFASLEDTVSGLEVQGRVRMKPRMLQTEKDHWTRVDADEVLYLEEDILGQTYWVTLRGRFRDLEAPSLDQALAKACRSGVFLRVSERYAVAPSRIHGVHLRKRGHHVLEVEGPTGGVVDIPLASAYLKSLEDCLDAINLGGGFLITDPED